MSNPFYSAMGGTMSLPQLLQQIKSDPGAILSRRFNLPQGVAVNDPNAILQHLIRTGQVSQNQVNAAYQQAQKFGLK